MKGITVNIFTSLRSESLGVLWKKQYFEKLLSPGSLLTKNFDRVFGKNKFIGNLTFTYAHGIFGAEKEPSIVITLIRSEVWEDNLSEEALFVLLVAYQLSVYLGQLSILLEIDTGDTKAYYELSNGVVSDTYKRYLDFKEKETDPRIWAEAVGLYFEEYNLHFSNIDKWLVKGLMNVVKDFNV